MEFLEEQATVLDVPDSREKTKYCHTRGLAVFSLKAPETAD